MTPESMLADATARIVSVQVGRAAPLGPQGVPSGFVKHEVNGPVHAGKLGLEGDEQAEPGILGAGDAMTLQARPNPNWSIARFHCLIAGLPAGPDDMAELTKLEGLAAHWREAARQAVSGP
jgi:MOSC domain-containing protein YiiM